MQPLDQFTVNVTKTSILVLCSKCRYLVTKAHRTTMRHELDSVPLHLLVEPAQHHQCHPNKENP